MSQPKDVVWFPNILWDGTQGAEFLVEHTVTKKTRQDAVSLLIYHPMFATKTAKEGFGANYSLQTIQTTSNCITG